MSSYSDHIYEAVEETLEAIQATAHAILPEVPNATVLEAVAGSAQISMEQARQAYAAIHALALGEFANTGTDPMMFRQKLLARQPTRHAAGAMGYQS